MAISVLVTDVADIMSKTNRRGVFYPNTIEFIFSEKLAETKEKVKSQNDRVKPIEEQFQKILQKSLLKADQSVNANAIPSPFGKIYTYRHQSIGNYSLHFKR